MSVARPTRWGNPFTVGDWGREIAVRLYRDMLSGGWSPTWVADLPDAEARFVYTTMADWRKRLGTGCAEDLARADLRGLDLACWCPLPAPGEPDVCHAAVLLEIANS